MAGGALWSRRVAGRCRTLRALARDTQRALHDMHDILHSDPEVSIKIQELVTLSQRTAAVVILGSSASARSRLLHCLLGRKLLPEPAPSGCRWIRIQYGSVTQVHLTLGNSEFELVEELHCNKKPWETLPVEDLHRQDATDLATVLEIELNNPFLKDGLKIIIPPDIESTSPSSISELKKQYTALYSKREMILKNFNSIYLYAVDKMGKCIFSDDFSIDSKIVSSRSEEDFWASFNLYCVKTPLEGEGGDSGEVKGRVRGREGKESGETPVFNAQNCLDLQQIKEIDPNGQVLFILFSDSVDSEDNRRESNASEATESTEDSVFRTEDLPESDQGLMSHGGLRQRRGSPLSDRASLSDYRRLYEEQTAFMNELLDQWELLTTPPQKHYVKSQYMIIDEAEILRSFDKSPSPPLGGSNVTLPSSESPSEEGGSPLGRSGFFSRVFRFATECMQSYLLDCCARLSELHIRLLQQLILASFELARELQLVPKKIQYVATREHHLYQTINEKFSEGDKKQELLQIMQEVLEEMRNEVNNMDWSVDEIPSHQDKRFAITNSVFYASYRDSPEQVSFITRTLTDQSNDQSINQIDDSINPVDQASDGEEAVSYETCNFDDYEIIDSNDESLCLSGFSRFRSQPEGRSVSPPPGAIPVENESELFSLSSAAARSFAGSAHTGASCSTGHVSVKQASLDVQHTVLSNLSRKISLKLVKFVDCLKDTYFGTLQRCLESLESSCRQELGGRPASEAMRQLLSVARQVDLQPCASFSLLRSLVDSLRRFFYRLRVSGDAAGAACCPLSAAWRRHAALQTVHSLAPHRLARIISTQILERLSVAHERYQSALTSLESALTSRLHHTEDVKLAIRKKYAPAFARLCLESTSMCDLLMYGTPELGREIGRGQYGVVYSVRGRWAGRSPCAAKSVLPADDRHYRDLAMEFFYTRSIPAHPRIVRLYGSVVQRHSGAGPTVLLVSERKARDLHAAVRAGLPFAARVAIACDIVEGIRYLHSLGLVHRDIKMKNVLLDSNDRASLSDLGFCAAEALISGSVVGTPVHMAPELLAGGYDASVDVYAFGILFWYICAGDVKLPSAFEVFQNKEQLWSKVKKGLRPERLPQFSDECWDIMQSCWHPEPSQRALLGHIEPRLHAVLQAAQNAKDSDIQAPEREKDNDMEAVSDDESLNMTGVDRDEI